MNTLHANFNGGLMSPRLAARVDLDKQRTGCVQLQNMLPTPFGGVFKRPGLEFIRRCRTTDEANRLIAFRRSTVVNFMLELSAGFIRILGETVAAPAYSSSVKYEAGQIVKTSSAGPGGISNIFWVCNVSYPQEAVAYPDPASSGRFIQIDGPTLSTTTDVVISSPFLESELFDIQHRQLNDVMFLAHPNHHPKRLTRVTDDHWKLEDVPFQFAPALDLNETRTAIQVQYDGVNPWARTWVTATVYKAGTYIQGVVASAGRIYVCTADHTAAAATSPGNGASWTTVWSLVATGYAIGDRVIAISGTYQDQIFTCHTAHGGATSDAQDEPGVGSVWPTYWNLGTSKVNNPAWTAGTSYSPGDKVRILDVIYECIAANVGSVPTSTRFGLTGGNQPGRGQFWVSFWKISSAGSDLSGLTFKLVATEDLFTADDVGTSWILEIGGTGRYMSFSVATGTTLGPSEPLFIQGPYLVTTSWGTNAAMTGSLYVEESLDGVTWSKIKEWNVASGNEGNINYDGEAPDVGAWYRIGAERDTLGTGGFFKIEAVSSVIKLPFKIDSFTSETSVKGNLVTVGQQLPPAAAIGVSTTNYRKPAFCEAEGYPRSVCFHDGRIWWAGTAGNGSRIWGSKLDDFYNFLTGANDDSGMDLTLGATEANDILWLASHNRAMVVGTTGQEWTIDGGDAETVIAPTKVRARMRTKHGSHGVAPESVAESLIWFTRGGKLAREFTYSFQIDGFTAPDMTQLLGQLDGAVVQTAYQSIPIPTIWAVTETGKLYSFSYDREQNITAWAIHSTGRGEDLDSIESVAISYGETSDEVWFVVNRNTGISVDTPIYERCVERFHPATFDWILSDSKTTAPPGAGDSPALCFTDFSILVNGYTTDTGSSPRMYVSGGDMLFEGLTDLTQYPINAMALWNYGAEAVIPSSGGSGTWADFTIESSGQFYVGIPYASVMESFPLEVQLQDGTGQGRKWRPNRITLILHDSMGGSYASDAADFTFDSALLQGGFDIQYPSAQDGPFTGRIDLHMGADWRDEAAVTLAHFSPLPFGVLGYVLKGEVSGS